MFWYQFRGIPNLDTNMAISKNKLSVAYALIDCLQFIIFFPHFHSQIR